jgi:hypothetical protein
MVKFCDCASSVVKELLLRTKSAKGSACEKAGSASAQQQLGGDRRWEAGGRTEDIVVSLGEELAALGRDGERRLGRRVAVDDDGRVVRVGQANVDGSDETAENSIVLGPVVVQSLGVSMVSARADEAARTRVARASCMARTGWRNRRGAREG